jgi:hypothetical protein
VWFYTVEEALPHFRRTAKGLFQDCFSRVKQKKAFCFRGMSSSVSVVSVVSPVFPLTGKKAADRQPSPADKNLHAQPKKGETSETILLYSM